MFCGYAPEPVVRAVAEAMAARQPVPAADRGRDRRLRGARPALRPAEVAVHARRPPRPTSRSIRVARVADRRATRCCSSTGSTTGTSTSPSSSSAPTARSCPRSTACRPTSPQHTVAGAVQRPRRAREGAGDRRHRPGDDRARADEQRRLLLPDDGFHEALRKLTRDAGTLLALDETHTQVFGPGGLTAQWNLDPDFVSAGKSIAAGVPFGAWGMHR